MLVKGLNDHLTHALGSTHHISRIYRFIRGDHDKTLRSVGRCRKSSLPGTEYIVFHGLIGTCFHQWHMFVGRCVINNIRFIMFEDPVDPVGITHRGNEHHQI